MDAVEFVVVVEWKVVAEKYLDIKFFKNYLLSSIELMSKK